MRSYESGQDKKLKNKGKNEVGKNHKESPGKEVVWTCDEKKGAQRRKEGAGKESTREKDERKTRENVQTTRCTKEPSTVATDTAIETEEDQRDHGRRLLRTGLGECLESGTNGRRSRDVQTSQAASSASFPSFMWGRCFLCDTAIELGLELLLTILSEISRS